MHKLFKLKSLLYYNVNLLKKSEIILGIYFYVIIYLYGEAATENSL